MNILLIVVLAILIIGVIVGWFRGFTNIIFETATTLVAIILAIVLCGPVAKAIIKNENLMGKLETKVSSALKLDEAANKVPSAEELFKNVSLPSVITDKIASGLDAKTQNTAKAAAKATAQFVSRLIIYVACFIVVFIVAIIAIHLLDKFFDLINKLPVIKEVNSLVGAAVGLLLALFVVWLFFAVVTLLGSTGFGASMLSQISSSKFLNFLYTNNIPMQFITNKVNSLL
jgi:uncharacterized membrane protein required for colicin V production